MRSLFVSVVAIACLAATARAEDIAGYDAEGDADASGGDPRVAALDDAFARAVSTALGDIVSSDVRSAKRGELDREIIGHARLWIARFTVTTDKTTDDRRQLSVSVRVDRDKMRARLAELKIETLSNKPSTDPRARPVVVLARVTSPTGMIASYGPGAAASAPGVSVLDSALRQVGMATIKPVTAGPGPRNGGELPASDEEAEALATGSKADLAAIMSIEVGPPVALRGLPTVGVLVTARIKLIEAKDGKLVGTGAATVASRGDGVQPVAQAIDHAVASAAVDVLPPVATKPTVPQPFRGDDRPLAESGIVNVRLPAKTPWSMVLAEQRFLDKAKGVTRATLRRVSPAGYVIGLSTSESVDRIAAIARKAPATDTSVAVKVIGDVVEVTLSGGP